jgi:UDP-N-acetylglucosamine 2-epimerase (non-hydrolysing)
MMKKVIVIAGARPNFIKIAQLMRELKMNKDSFDTLLVHTGQHYDFDMSEVFFKNLKIPKPDIFLNIGSASHAVQTARIMSAFEKVIIEQKPDLVIVLGDVNSTLACSLVASKLGIAVAHVEAGLRSFDRAMPEEINRIVTDALSDYYFVSEKSGVRNIEKEGINSGQIHFVGNIMIDTLLLNIDKIKKSDILTKLGDGGIKPRNYSVLTLHRPSNVDSEKSLAEIYDILLSVSRKINIVYPVHPRTRKMIETHNFLDKFKSLKNLVMTEPVGYIDFIKLVKESVFVLTDSGGIQEETTVLKVPCLTMRENTERPVTVKEGTNILVGRNKRKIVSAVNKILQGKWKKSDIPEFWDGKTAERIVEILFSNGKHNKKLL